MRRLFVNPPTYTEEDLIWVRKGEGKRQHDIAVQRLQALHIFRKTGTGLVMNQIFQESMQRVYLGGGEHRSFGVPSEGDRGGSVDVAFLDQYARAKWENILHYMVGSEGSHAPSQAVLSLLQRSDLMRGADEAGLQNHLGITSRGFQFLLEDVNTQLWDLLLQYLSLAESRGMDLVEVLSFLFMLGSLTLGQAYSTEDLPATQVKCLEEFRDYGLVYQSRPDLKHFYPTRLATTLTNNEAQPLAGGAGPSEDRGFIVLETNYRFYAYTSNPLRVAVLRLFAHVKAQFPNLLIGAITRESIKAALGKGISAEQVITYLSHHAHPQMIARNDPLLPITVTDQIRLWEREKNRVQEDVGLLYYDFRSLEDYRSVRDYAKSLSVLLWEDEGKRKFFIEARGQQSVKDFIRRRLVP